MLLVFSCNGQTSQTRDSQRPAGCPCCGCQDCLIGHGYYSRKPKGSQEVDRVWIKRWLCKSCRRTLSMLPDILLSSRHYLLVVIRQVLEARFEHKWSWAELKANYDTIGMPALRTMQRWCKSFGREALRWLGIVQETLARQDSSSTWLDPQGEALKAQRPAEALLVASEHLLAWAKTQWVEIVGYGRNERMHFLWLWGANMGLGRLV
ncbi:MAG: DUF6431 domain-containing protein [Chloroflexi bacterium]|nr:DUF6431 domain-containing protein [Chloroflexota bacterium]